MHKDYFQGILQLRNVDNEVIDFVSRQAAKRQDVFIAKIEKVRNGIDIYFSSQQYLKALGRKLQEHFRGELVISSKLFTKSRTGEDLYRVNVLFRQAKFRKGDIITYRGSKLKIIRMGNKVACRYVDTGKSITLSYDSLR